MSAAFAWVLTVEGIPQALSQLDRQLGPVARWPSWSAVNILLLVFGIFIEPLPGVMILVPILAPMAAALGIDPTHFAIVVIVNLTMGLITPPVGGLLFVTAVSTRVSITALTREMPPFLLAHFVVLALLTFVPQLSTWLPHSLGF